MTYASVRGGIAATALVLATASYARAESYTWVQFVPGGVEARVTTTEPACPEAKIDGQIAAMAVHAAPGENYPVTTCKVALPKDAKSATIGGLPLALPKAEPTRILVIGDTGCRMKGKKVQACNDPVAWPFALLAQVAAHQKPDLVLHVGDYHYRETVCPEGNLGCAGSPFGDTWEVWRADFFAPADTLLRTAPWVMTRGNHEECHRGGKGWSRTLEGTAFDAQKGCNGLSDLYTVDLGGGLTLAVMDVSTAAEEKADAAGVERFRAQFKSLAGKGRTWVTLHRPIWSVEEVENGANVGDNRTLAEAAQADIPGNVQALLSGHHHSFIVYNFEADLPVQIVSGHGGDYLDKGPPANPAGIVINGKAVKSGINVAKKFGFSMLEKQANGDWQLINHDIYGKQITRCTLTPTGRTVTCAAVS